MWGSQNTMQALHCVHTRLIMAAARTKRYKIGYCIVMVVPDGSQTGCTAGTSPQRSRQTCAYSAAQSGLGDLTGSLSCNTAANCCLS